MTRTSGNHRRHHVTTRLELFRTCHQTHKNLQYATNELSQNECVLPSDMMPTGLTTKNETGVQTYFGQNGTEKHVSMVHRIKLVLQI